VSPSLRKSFVQGLVPMHSNTPSLQSSGTLTRRQSLRSLLFGGGYLGLRMLATGLPAYYLRAPAAVTAQDLSCAISAKDKLQYLIVSASSAGDPINCNVPGTYEAPEPVHPQQATMTPVSIRLGDKSYKAAQPWADTAAGGQLSAATLSRTLFFHHSTRTTVHGDQPKVMKLLGATQSSEMMVSAYAKHLAGCFGTVQPEPIAVGAQGRGDELLSYGGRNIPGISPTQLKQLLTGNQNDALARLRSLRDSSLDELNRLAKQDATGIQQQFLDALALSQSQVRALADQLRTALDAIQDDGVQSQAIAAAALISANVTPVVTVRIPFGGDNHSDQDLQNEADQHVTGVQSIQAVMDALAGFNLTDKTTFATWNVFGRSLNGPDKVERRAGRDHLGSHSVMLMIGANIKAGVIGGITPDKKGYYAASAIDSGSGAPAQDGDIPTEDTQLAAARTLGAALGIPEESIASSLAANAGGSPVGAALVAG